MSRIDEALRKAREQAEADRLAADRAEAHATPAGPARPPAPDPFQAPWQFEPGSEAEAAAPMPAGRARPGDEADALAPRFTAPAASASVAAPPDAAPDAQALSAPAQHAPERSAASVAAEPVRPAPRLIESAGDAPAVASPTGPMAVFKGFDDRVVERLVTYPKAKSGMVEQYRKLAGTLHHAQLERNIRTVMISSALAGEGKTLTATNLALTLSESFRRQVLLIDADLRRPTLHEIFQVPNLAGLGDGLRAADDERLPLIQVSARLSLLTAGRPDPDPMSGLSSERMRRILEEAAARFEWVIVDTPPIDLLPDAHFLGAIVDTTLLVIEAGSTPHPLVRKAIDTIDRDRILGIVLNRAEETIGFDYYHRYYNHYDREHPHSGQ